MFTISTVAFLLLLADGPVAATSLRVCPFDIAVYPGDNVILRCATESGHMIRWYRGTDYSDVIYGGTTMYRLRLTDDRYAVRDDGNGSVDLHITAVKPTDAGVYMCYDLTTYAEGIANIVVVDPLMKSSKTVNQQHQSTVVDHTCSFTFHGQLKPTVEWMDESGHVLSDVISQTNVTADHVIESTTNDRKASECRLTFELFNCGHHAERIHFPVKQQLDISCSSPINELVIYVSAITATVVVVFLLLAVICCKRFKTRKIQDIAKYPEYCSPLQHPVQHHYEKINKAPPTDNTQQSTQNTSATSRDHWLNNHDVYVMNLKTTSTGVESRN